MSIKETLTDSKNKLDVLLDFANNTTGNSDTNIGDAIKALVDGYGQGNGLSIQQTNIADKTISGERWSTASTTQANSSYSRTEPIDVSEYDFVAIINNTTRVAALRSSHCFLSNSISSKNIITGYSDNLNGDISNAYLFIKTKDYDWLMLSSPNTQFDVLVYPVFGKIEIV